MTHELNGRGREHRPQRSVDAPRGEHAGVQHADGQAERELDDDEERVQVPDVVVVGGKRERQDHTAHDRHGQRQDHRQDHPLADLALDGVAIPGLGELPQSLAHHLQQAPPRPADDEAADAQDHDGERRQSAESGEDDQEFGDVDDEPRRVEHEHEPHAVAEVREEPAGQQARVQGHRAVLATGGSLEPTVDVVRQTRETFHWRWFTWMLCYGKLLMRASVRRLPLCSSLEGLAMARGDRTVISISAVLAAVVVAAVGFSVVVLDRSPSSAAIESNDSDSSRLVATWGPSLCRPTRPTPDARAVMSARWAGPSFCTGYGRSRSRSNTATCQRMSPTERQSSRAPTCRRWISRRTCKRVAVEPVRRLGHGTARVVRTRHVFRRRTRTSTSAMR